MRELEDMSYKDALTGFGNRFAMNRYISQIDHKKSVGVVYCDITGLKHVNDTMGHKAGDQLILRACDCMSKAFGDYGVFRIGGDELLALCSQIEQDALEERIRLLRKLMEENTVNMAVGMIWQDEATTELDILLQESEKRMYADKAEYYRSLNKAQHENDYSSLVKYFQKEQKYYVDNTEKMLFAYEELEK